MMVLQAISDGRSDACARSMAAAMRLGIMPVDALGAPAGGLEALHLVDAVGQRQRPVDRDAVVVEQHDRGATAAGARRARWPPARCLPSGRRRRPAHRCGGRRCRRRTAAAISRSASAKPTAVAMPWPSGPVVVSTPGGVAELGMARRLGAQLAEALQLVERHARRAGEVEQRVEQHRAVAGRQDEAVAVGPARRRRDRTSGSA